MQTVETAHRDAAPAADDARGAARRGLRAAVRAVGVVAALLAYGLLGLLVWAWLLRPGRRAAHADCRGCRRRRGVVMAVTFGLAGMVVAGSVLAAHQEVTGPRLPDCSVELPESMTTAGRDDSLGDGRDAWLQARQLLTAPITGLTRHWVADRGGGLCRAESMTLAFLPSGASDSPVAVGNVIVTNDRSSMGEHRGRALARHESRHVTQWAALTVVGGPLAMPSLYAVDEAFFPHSRNHFERAAGLADGDYSRPPSYGPQPEWTKVTVLGMLVVFAGRRRFRWFSRVLTGGRAAARAHQPGRCALHSEGWFRLDPA